MEKKTVSFHMARSLDLDRIRRLTYLFNSKYYILFI